MTNLSTRVTKTLALSGTGAQGQLFWSSDPRDAGFPKQAVRLYGKFTEKFSSSGSLVQRASESESIKTTLAFTGSNKVTVQHPDPSGLVFARAGSFFAEDGSRVAPTLTYDQSKNEITSDISGFGLVNLSYKASYKLYHFIFSGGPCRPDSGFESVYNDAMLIAINTNTGASATLQLAAPLCPGTTINFGDKVQPRLKLEIDPARTPALRAGGTVPIAADADIRLYPNTAANLIVNAGSLVATGQAGVHTVTESLTFSGSSAAGLSYTPIGGVALQVVGGMSDEFGNSFSANPRGPGSVVQEVTWINSNTFEFLNSRDVGDDEVVVTDNGRAKPGYGVVRATYSTSYKVYRYQFAYDGDRTFTPGFVVAHAGDTSATLRLDLPGGGSL